MSIDLKLDLTFARVTGEQIDEYVHAEVLYYPIGAMDGMKMPQLTLGMWLETVWRLKALAALLKADEQAVLDEAQMKVQRVRSRVPNLYKEKSRREFKSRLDVWGWYLDDVLAREPAAVPPEGQAYATQVHVRFKLGLLQEDVTQMQDQVMRLSSNDRRLRARFASGPFVWESELSAQAQVGTYWWLYGHPA
ncbi:MAG TPA: hypothetical protein VGK81_09070 [Anaerolineae bacterium]